MSAHDDPGAGRDRPDDVGSLAEEAAKLLGVVAGWAQEHGTTPEGPDRSAGAPECEWCPVCRTAHWLRGTSPEVRDHLTSAAASLAQAAAALLAAAGGEQARGTARRPGPVQHIDLDPDTGPAPEDVP